MLFEDIKVYINDPDSMTKLVDMSIYCNYLNILLTMASDFKTVYVLYGLKNEVLDKENFWP